MCNTPTAILSHPGALSAVVQGIEKTGRRPVLLAENEDRTPRDTETSRQPADHAGGAQPDRAPDPDLADSLHGLDEHAVTSASRPSILAGREHFPGRTRARQPRARAVRHHRAALLQRGRPRAAGDRADHARRWTPASSPTSCSCIDDASPTTRSPCSARRRPRYPHLRVMPFRRNGGSGTARRIGTQQARGEIVVWTDADMTYENERIPELVAHPARRRHLRPGRRRAHHRGGHPQVGPGARRSGSSARSPSG